MFGRLSSSCLVFSLFCSGAPAVEIVVQNDSVVVGGNSTIQSGFVAGESGAAWLDSPCDGNIVAVQILWLSVTGNTGQSLESAINIFEAGAFPNPGTLLETIGGPLMTDGAINEFRFLDKNNTIPLNVPVTENQTFVVSFMFSNSPNPSTASLVTDLDGCQAGRNSIFAIPPNIWFSSCLLGVTGDFAIRAVVDCPAGGTSADLAINQTVDPPEYTDGQMLTFTITASNNGPDDAPGSMVTDTFSNELSNVQWSCMANNGASCGTTTNGSGDIAQTVDLPTGGNVVITATATVLPGTSGLISNTAEVFVPAGFTDPVPANNLSLLQISPLMQLIFRDGFEAMP